MKSAEIRQWHKDLEGTSLGYTDLRRLRAQIEIAAQLADLNEANRPRWVWFSYNGNKLPINAKMVHAIGIRDPDHSYIYMPIDSDPWIVDGTVEEVAALLGIPLEGQDEAETQDDLTH